MKLFKKKCQHEYKSVGLFYKETLTEYRNGFDTINVYERKQCIKCGKYTDELISHEEFLPEVFTGRDARKTEYVQLLKAKNILLEIELCTNHEH